MLRGRKRACITYCITYILSCITKHSPQYKVLMVGRILGGIATSLLFSAFESWLVAEHNKVMLQLFITFQLLFYHAKMDNRIYFLDLE
jgi:predicted MFS family arabinose efflux permease